MNRFSLLFVGLLSWLPGLQAASIYSLAGSYTSLPVEWRELSLLHGAIALETGMLKRLYTIDGLSYPSEHARKLVKEIFYQVPDTDEFTVSKKITENKELLSTKIIPDIINNIAALQLLQQLNSSELEDNQKTIARNMFQKNWLKKIGDATTKSFSLAEPEIAIAILTGALWFIKKTIPGQDFTYQTILNTKQNEIIKAIPTKITETAIKAVVNNVPVPNTTQNTTLSAEDYETKVIEILTQLAGMAQHPEHLNYQKARVLINGNQSEGFPDCVETTMRNLFNILAYDPETKSLSAQRLQTKFPNARQELLEFYTNYPKFSKSPDTTDASQKDQAAYNAWAQLVSNIPGVQYNKPEKTEEKTYELRPTYPNLLMISSYLLGLSWFDNLQQYPNNPDEFTQEHMAKFIKLFGSADKPITEEYGKLTINTERGYAFTIDLKQGHGDMEYGQQTKGSQEQLDIGTLAAYPQLYNLTESKDWPSTPDSLWYIFSQHIDDPNRCSRLFNKLKAIPYSWIPLLEDLVNRHQDRDAAEYSVLDLYTNVIRRSVNSYPDTQKTQLVEKAIAAATKGMKNFAVQDNALTLLRELVIKDQAFAEAIIAATMWPVNGTLIEKQLQLLLELVKKNQALTQASSIATQASRNGIYRNTTLNILDIVLDKEKSLKIKIVDAISQLAIKEIESSFEHDKTFELFRWLFQKKEGFQQAIQAAQKLSLSKENNILERSLRLFNLLNEYGQALDTHSLQTREHIAQKLAAINKDLSNNSKFIGTTDKLLAGAAALGALAYGGYRWYTANQRTIAPAQQNQPLAWPWNITTRLESVGTPTALPTPQSITAAMNTNTTAPLMAP